MIIRALEQRDQAAWRSLILAYGVFYKTAFDDTVLDGVWEWFVDPEHEVKALVAVQDDGIVGLAHYRRLADTFTAAPAWFLDDLYVTEEARGTGVATSLIEAVAALRKHRAAALCAGSPLTTTSPRKACTTRSLPALVGSPTRKRPHAARNTMVGWRGSPDIPTEAARRYGRSRAR